ncbi:transporter substrate-binding domain-containing protein [Herbaspirillum sp. LeCh32-8]|uniref:transporter substrate-binding domain-containing protein n=1 Tax=Herbaspirillum sp. LeCh32-8 TaxID=2821356 RepID=UPI001AE8D776|nr:transporter substrate-binding domain-containing protein [Herbaspirillum sp. LeCh32-8]MBP0599213.1 transporter substrate-binding domain-containing protein [Herbaspirillum sp. LeCh32-8]
MSLKKILFAVCLLCTALSALGQDLLDVVRTRGVLRVAVEGTYPPFNFKDRKSGQLDGFDIEFARALAVRLGVKAEFVATEWAAILAGLQVGKYDVIISEVTMTPRREAEFDFSRPYTYSLAQVIQRQDDRSVYSTLDSLKGKRVGVGQGSSYADLLNGIGGIEVKTYVSTPLNLQDLANGRIDAALNDRLLVPYMIREARLPLRAATALGPLQKQGIALRKNNPALKRAIDRAIDDMIADGSYAKLSMKWFGLDASRIPAP